jgi:hypothetical protein
MLPETGIRDAIAAPPASLPSCSAPVKKGYGKNLTFQKISDRFSITTIEKVIILGLDQYLEARKYVSKFDYPDGFDSKTPSEEYANLSQFAPAGFDRHSDFGGIQVSYPIGYWRKANAIHGWFVENVQGGEDNCQSYFVSREKLAELAEACEEVLKVPAGASQEDIAATSGLLPRSGFFFGSTEMDEWYMQDLKTTIEIVNHALSLFPADNYDWSFCYSSSW